jgi:hypothetical protein
MSLQPRDRDCVSRASEPRSHRAWCREWRTRSRLCVAPAGSAGCSSPRWAVLGKQSAASARFRVVVCSGQAHLGGGTQVPTIARDAPLRIRSPLCESLRWRAIMSCSRLIRGCTVGAGSKQGVQSKGKADGAFAITPLSGQKARMYDVPAAATSWSMCSSSPKSAQVAVAHVRLTHMGVG